jgi:hypothetical protein
MRSLPGEDGTAVNERQYERQTAGKRAAALAVFFVAGVTFAAWSSGFSGR